MCWSLFLITLQAWGLQQRVFPATIVKFIKSNCFYRSLPLAAFYCSNQSKIIQEITASKFQGEHATLLNRYQSLCPATKSEITAGFPMEFWEILEKLPSKVILVGCFWKENRRRRTCSDPLGFRFQFFPGQLFIKQWGNVLY